MVTTLRPDYVGKINRTYRGIVVGLLALAMAASGMAARNVEVTSHAGLFAALLSPLLLLAVPAVAVLYLLTRRWWLAAVAVVASVALLAPLLPRGGDHMTGVDVRVMSINLYEGRADPRAVIDLARDHADVLSVQELTPKALRQLSEAGIDRVFPHRFVIPSATASGAGLWSRYPLTPGGASSEPIPISARVAVSGVKDGFTVVVVHPSAPWPWPIDWWRDEIARFPGALDSLTGPVVVAGDFNSNHDIAQFRRILDRRYRDANPFAPTYPANRPFPPLLAIDHILTRNASSSSPWTATIPGSDHRALLATVTIPHVPSPLPDN